MRGIRQALEEEGLTLDLAEDPARRVGAALAGHLEVESVRLHGGKVDK